MSGTINLQGNKMKKLRLIYILTCLWIMPPLGAQQMNPAMKGLFPQKEDGPMQKRSIKTLTLAGQGELMQGTTKRSDHLAVEVPPDYIEQITSLNIADLKLRSVKSPPKETIMGLSFLGVKDETKNRRAYFFGKDGKAMAMITVWYFAADGASTVTYDEMVNQKIEGMDATLSLAYSKKVRNCLWKLAANDVGRYYDIVIPDTISENKTQMPVPRVLNEMQKLVNFVKAVE